MPTERRTGRAKLTHAIRDYAIAPKRNQTQLYGKNHLLSRERIAPTQKEIPIFLAEQSGYPPSILSKIYVEVYFILSK
jgi:hypothetical protein